MIVITHSDSSNPSYENSEYKFILVVALIACMFCFTTSWLYHLFRDVSENHSKKYLKMDLIGIVIMIFALSFTGIWLGFTRYSYERAFIVGTLLMLFGLNFIFSLTPCYNTDKYEKLRVGLYVLIVALCFALSFLWYFGFAEKDEIDLFFKPLMLSFVYLGLGFLFYKTRFPESVITENKFGPRVAYITQIYF